MSLALVVSRSRQAHTVYHLLVTFILVDKLVLFTMNCLTIAMIWVMLVIDPIWLVFCSLLNLLTRLLDQDESMSSWLLRFSTHLPVYHGDVKSQSSPRIDREFR